MTDLADGIAFRCSQYFRTYNIVELSFQATPNSDEQFQHFISRFNDLVYQNTHAPYVHLIIDLDCMDLQFAYKYVRRMRQFLEEHTQEHIKKHDKSQLASTYIITKNNILRQLVAMATPSKPQSRIFFCPDTQHAIQLHIKRLKEDRTIPPPTNLQNKV